nr:hypothetical protein [uncultured Anaerocolumna sp.]
MLSGLQCPTCLVKIIPRILGTRDISLLYLYQKAKKIKRQKVSKKNVSGLSRDAVTAMLEAPILQPKQEREISFFSLFIMQQQAD